MNMTYEDKNTGTILLAEATNAFNLLNIQSFLHNINYLCLLIAIFVKKMLQHSIKTFHQRDSIKGTTPGDPFPLAIYGPGVTPLFNM